MKHFMKVYSPLFSFYIVTFAGRKFSYLEHTEFMGIVLRRSPITNETMKKYPGIEQHIVPEDMVRRVKKVASRFMWNFAEA